jgi:glycosyltransferase involved in cell wall biosynthesis
VTQPVPKVSVVVSTYDRPARLAAALAGLRAQTLAVDEFEVVVVDNGSAGTGTQEVLAEELARGALRLRTIRHQTTRGPAGGRNSGWRVASAPLIAFTDDDCVPDASWLESALQVSDARPGAIVQGRTEPNPAELDRNGLFSRTVTVRTLGPQYETCNIFYPRELLDRLGGFDETFGLVPAGEDTDLAWRALETGGEAVLAARAIVFHAVHELGPLGMLREAARWTDAPRLFARHPQTRRMLNRGVFWNGWHYCVVRSLVALALPRPVRRVLWARHAIQLSARAQDAGAGAWAVPFLLACDVIEVASVARGGVRYRTFVL